MTDARAPHKAILSIQIEIHEVLNTGECSGNTVSKKDLENKGVKENILLSVDGFDRSDCIKKLKEKLKQFNDD